MTTLCVTTFVEKCMIERIEEKLDYLIERVNGLSGIRGFGDNLIANIIGNILIRQLAQNNESFVIKVVKS